MTSAQATTETALRGRTIVMSGGSRGIGLAILVAAARHGANAVLLAKTSEPHPRLPGTVHTAVAEIEAAGGKAVAVVGDVRNEADVQPADHGGRRGGDPHAAAGGPYRPDPDRR